MSIKGKSRDKMWMSGCQGLGGGGEQGVITNRSAVLGGMKMLWA